MPFHRGVYLKHPQTGEDGLWLELSTDPPGTLTGMAKSAWPAPLALDTPSSYGATLSAAFNALCFRARHGQVVAVTLTLSGLNPLTLDPDAGAVVGEGDCKCVAVASAKPAVS